MAEGIISGKRAGAPQPITSIDDSGVERLAVDSKVSGVAEIELSELNDEVAVYGGVDGSETADAATRQIINVDSLGRQRIIGSAADGAAPVGEPVLVAGSDGTNVQTVRTDVNGIPRVTGTVSHDAADNGDPVKIGGKATATVPADVTTGDRVDAWFDPSGAAVVAGSDGTNSQPVRTDTGGRVSVYQKSLSSGFADNVANNQSFPIAEDGTLLVQVPFNYYYDGIGNNWDRMRGNSAGGMVVQGPVAHDAVTQGNPIINGNQAVAHGVNPTDVAVGDITMAWASRAGIPFVIGGHPNVRTTEYTWTTAQTDDDILGAIATSNKVIVTSIAMTLDEATTVGVKVRVGFGTASVPAEPADGASVEDVILSHVGIVPGGGITRGDGSGILGIGGDGAELRITAEAPTSGTGKLVVTWYTVGS